MIGSCFAKKYQKLFRLQGEILMVRISTRQNVLVRDLVGLVCCCIFFSVLSGSLVIDHMCKYPGKFEFDGFFV